MVDLSFYSGKNVLVTGGAGFIGSSLVEKLHENEANISVLDDFSHGSFENLPSNNIEIIEGSVCHFESVLIAVKGIDIVFSLASKPFIPHSYVRPRDSIEVNVNGMFNVLEACAKENISRIVHLSSSEVYGTAQYTPMDEKHPLQPHSVYSISKLFSDRLCYIYHKEKKLPVTILRPFNAYGPRETHRYIIPETIHQFHNSTVLVT
jgi:nucleoside-diphosphate-sugar epimerase